MACKFGIDVVDGVVIGEVSHRAEIWSQRGMQKRFFVYPGESALEMANKWIADKKTEIGEAEFRYLWPDGLELREYDD